MRQALWRVIVAACAAMLASCGGSGGGDASTGSRASPRTLTLVAGTLDAGGPGSADGTGAAARFSASDLAVGTDGNVYVADSGNSTIRRVTPEGVATTPWGRAGEPDSIDGSAAAARLRYPKKISAAPDGSLYVIDSPQLKDGGNVRLRRIAPDGAVNTALLFSVTLLPSDDVHWNTVVDGSARLYFVDSDHCQLYRVDLGKPDLQMLDAFPRSGSTCSIQADLGVDREGGLYYVEKDARQGTLVMKRRSPAGAVSTVFTSPVAIHGFTVSPDGVVVFHDGRGVLYTVSPGGTPQRLSGTQAVHARSSVDGNAETARFSNIDKLAADAANRVWVLEQGSVVRRLDTDGSVVTVAGRAPQVLYRPGTGEQARLGGDGATSMVADAAGNAYWSGAALEFRAIARVTPEGVVSTFAGSLTEHGTQDGSGSGARFELLGAMARDPKGALFVTDWRESTACERYSTITRSVVRRVGADGNVSTLPYSFDGEIGRLAPLAGGSVLVQGERAITNCTTEPKAAEVTAAGQETRVPALPLGPTAGDGLGTTWFIKGGAIVKRFADGRLTTVAGSETEFGDRDGAGAEARFSPSAQGIDVDGAGNVYVADTGNGTVRKITPDGTVTSIVGRANQHGVLLGALPGGLDHPTAVAVTPQGLLIRSRAALLRASW